ncbi:hypothetical protein [Tahibacter amnicola]|uniref:Ig-like domain-containing protein n=1 Tax=Tahibacter amnicola TaxID=2976241 RepID=A0ABY6BPW3_9GAMM|nr:hypothetical protein [Tahibacter amnicola]UXI70601.1 hypothetical protein N4264_13445 [Tahibacter amnicola]
MNPLAVVSWLAPGLAAFLPAALAADTARLPDPAPIVRSPEVWVRFNPSTILAGEATTVTWQGRGAEYCRFWGVPGLGQEAPGGSRVLRPTASLTAEMECAIDMPDAGNSATATLTVIPASTPPQVSARFSPASIPKGQSTTLTWSTQYATQCTSTGLASISGPSGNVTLAPTASGSVTITCTRAGAPSTTVTANVTVTPPLPPQPMVHASANPTYMTAPGTSWIHWWSTNATSCSLGPTSGTYSRYFAISASERITCFGPGGTGFAVVFVTVDLRGKMAPVSSRTAKDAARLGLDLAATGMEVAELDINGDSQPDLLAVDTVRRQAYVSLRDGGRLSSINRTIDDVASLSQFRSVSSASDDSRSLEIDIAR